MPISKIDLLVVDDDDINIFIIRKIVEKTGCEVNMVTKSNGEAAMEYLDELLTSHKSLPHLMLVDINMPVLNGWEFLEAFQQKAVPESIAIYMVSSSVYENDIEKAKGYKFVKGFISKPLSLDRMKELLQSVVIK